MPPLPFTKGRRLFTVASYLTLGVAALHTYGMSQSFPPDFDIAAQAMRSATMDTGIGMHPSLMDIYHGLGFTMSIALGMMGILGIVLGSSAEAHVRILSRVAVVLTTASAAMTALYWVLKIAPPFVSMATLTVLWGISIRTTRFA